MNARTLLFGLVVLALMAIGVSLAWHGQGKEASYCAGGLVLLFVRPPQLAQLLHLLQAALGRAGGLPPPAPASSPKEEPPCAP